MADTEYAVNDPMAVKLWSKIITHETELANPLKEYISTEPGNVVLQRTDTQKQAGDTITFALMGNLNNPGVLGDAEIEGFEEELSHETDSLTISQQRNGVRSAGRLSEQRVPWSVRETAMRKLKNWLLHIKQLHFHTQLSGTQGTIWNPQTRTYVANSILFTGLNPVAERSRIIYANNAADAAGVVTAGDNGRLKLSDIDLMVEYAGGDTRMNPLDRGDYDWVLFCSPADVTSLRNSVGDNRWFTIQQSLLQGGQAYNRNEISRGGVGIYNRVKIVPTPYAQPASDDGVSNEATRVSVLCGQQAANCAFGEGYTEGKYMWHEETFDAGNKVAVYTGFIGGLKRSSYLPAVGDATDYGSVAFVTHAPRAYPDL